MQGRLRRSAAFTVMLLAVGTARAIAAPAIYPLSQVKRGQKGYGLTTFNGYEPEKFTFEVVSVMPNFLPKQSIVLVKTDDPKLAVSGFWQGMSGSPLYIEDKVMCAFSYGFRFNKIALGGCTPIEYMIADAQKPRRGGSTVRGVTTGPSAPTVANQPRSAAPDFAALQSRSPSALGFALPKAPSLTLGTETVRASLPVAVGGFSEAGLAFLQDTLSPTGMVPMRTGATGGAIDPTAPTSFKMGASISVVMMRGDMTMAATGTVSYIDGDTVLAFGHPFMQSGETYAPVTNAYVHTVIPSAQSAFVMATPQRELGALVADQQSSISATTKLRSPMIPMKIHLTYGTKDQKQTNTFAVEIASNKFMTPMLAGAALTNAVSYYLPDREDVTALITSTVKLVGVPTPLTLTDYAYANDGAASVMRATRGVRVLGLLLDNAYAPLMLERLDIHVDLAYDTNWGEIKELRMPATDLVPGSRNYVDVVMETYNGADIVERVGFDVPAALAGAVVGIEVAPGDAAKLDAPTPVDLPSLLYAASRLLPGNVWTVTLYAGEEGFAVEGKSVRDAPPSVTDKLRPQFRASKLGAYRPLHRTTTLTKRALSGVATTMARVGQAPR